MSGHGKPLRVPRDPWALGLPNPCNPRDPRLLLWRLRHRLTGPRRGCSCTRCFHHPKRRVPAREFIHDRLRIAELEERVRALDGKHPGSRWRESR